MEKIITEGQAKIKIPVTKKISREMPIFYNPVMELNRTISILLLNLIPKDNMQLADPLAASGIRSIRFLLELNRNKIKSISLNDNDKDFLKNIKKQFVLNHLKIDSKIRLHNEDANLFMLKSTGFDYIDIDPFGSPNPFLDTAIKRLSRGGILAVTATDTSALCGTYPDACLRKYWAMNRVNYLMHETGLRILIRKVQLIGLQYEKALLPIFSYSKNHYMRVFFKCAKGKKECGIITKQHGFICDSGPLWTGSLWDGKLALSMHRGALKYYKDQQPLAGLLRIIKEESKIKAVGFYDMSAMAKKYRLARLPKKTEFINKVKAIGYDAAETHFSQTGIRSTAPEKRLIEILKEIIKIRRELPTPH